MISLLIHLSFTIDLNNEDKPTNIGRFISYKNGETIYNRYV